jgi:predicted nucleotidyltransferase
MIPAVKQRLDEVRALCRRFGVARLELFGSATQPTQFDPADSDLDFLVEFGVLPPGGNADAYFGLKEALEGLFGRPVDLVMTRAIRNRFFLQAVAGQRELLYAA